MQSRAIGSWAALLACALALAAGGCGEGETATRRRVLLVTVDTLRPDYLGAWGYPLPTSPFLDALFERGHVFERAIAPVPLTTPALASLLTGAYPKTTGVRELVDRVAPDVATLAELLAARGWATAAVVTNNVIPAERGLARGFAAYDHAGDERDAAATTRAMIEQLRAVAGAERIFAWVHYIDPHMPYVPEPGIARAFDPGYDGRYALQFGGDQGWQGRRAFPADLPKGEAVHRNPLPARVNEHVRRLYAGDVRRVDDAVAELLGFARQELGDEWLVVFTADHGESLGEHGYHFDHGEYVYNPSLRVPLAFVFPEGDPLHGAGRSDAWVSLVDVFPTLVELLGLPCEAAAGCRPEGRSLVPLLRGEEGSAPPLFAESGKSRFPELVRRRVKSDVSGRFRAVIDGGWKLIWTPGREDAPYELFDLESDPGEARDLYRPEHPEAVRLAALLREWSADGPRAETAPSEADLEALRALGYVEDAEPEDADPKPEDAAPKPAPPRP
jgi:arylsulfatase A-like enzyme